MQESRAQGEEAAAAVCKCRRWEANPCFGCLLSMSLCLFHMIPGVLSTCLQWSAAGVLIWQGPAPEAVKGKLRELMQDHVQLQFV